MQRLKASGCGAPCVEPATMNGGRLLNVCPGFLNDMVMDAFPMPTLTTKSPSRIVLAGGVIPAAAREYLLTADAMREAMKGFDFNRALDVLQELSALQKPGADGKRARLLRIGGQRPVRLYPINPDKLTGGDHGA